ncbi:MAG: hypothetical protein U0350_04555 [Caldilineaceae bacterium]
MNQALLEQLQTAQAELDPQFKALREATGALKQALRLAGEEKADALAMQKELAKLRQAGAAVTNASLQTAIETFAAETQTALDALAFAFAHDLRATFEQRGQSVEGRPPTLVVGALVLQIDIAGRKAQWFYGKEALTRPIALSINTIIQAYDAQRKAIVDRKLDAPVFLAEVYKAWKELLDKRERKPTGGRINLVETYSQVVLNRQSPRFWNAPSRSSFKDYDRPLFVRDLVLAQATPTVDVDGKTQRLRLGVATKSQADNASRSIWLPNGPLDGEYYSDITFE